MSATYIDKAIASFDGDHADTDFQRGYLAALKDVRDEGGYPEMFAALDSAGLRTRTVRRALAKARGDA